MLQKNTVEITGNVISEKMQCTFTRRLKGKFFSPLCFIYPTASGGF